MSEFKAYVITDELMFDFGVNGTVSAPPRRSDGAVVLATITVDGFKIDSGETPFYPRQQTFYVEQEDALVSLVRKGTMTLDLPSMGYDVTVPVKLNIWPFRVPWKLEFAGRLSGNAPAAKEKTTGVSSSVIMDESATPSTTPSTYEITMPWGTSPISTSVVSLSYYCCNTV